MRALSADIGPRFFIPADPETDAMTRRRAGRIGLVSRGSSDLDSEQSNGGDDGEERLHICKAIAVNGKRRRENDSEENRVNDSPFYPLDACHALVRTKRLLTLFTLKQPTHPAIKLLA